MLDLEPAAQQMARLIAATPDERLASATPCDAYSLGDLLDHVGGLTRAFTTAATKQGESTGATSAPQGDAANLPDDWRTRVPADLDELVIAWRDPEAWTGMTAAGGTSRSYAFHTQMGRSVLKGGKLFVGNGGSRHGAPCVGIATKRPSSGGTGLEACGIRS